jgi:hypothetical protein
MDEVMYLEIEKSGWLFFGVVRFFNFGMHLPTLFLVGSILFVALRFRKTWRDRKKM